jgi:molecular chaperone HtpG
VESEEKDDGETAVAEADFNRLVGRFVTTLGDKVVEVRESKVLKNSPVRLVYPEDAQNREMQRLYRMMGQDYEVPKLIFEVNRSHPLIANMARLVEDDADSELVTLEIEQLYDSALMQEGLHPNPTAMLPRIEQLMLLAAK